jgi:acylphosphatase
MMMIIYREIRVKGKVQGVNFRYHTKQAAERLGISGTVQNCDDGTVLIFAQGEEQRMDAFMEWCCTGPSRAMVVGIEVGETGNRDYVDFNILR